MMEAAGASRKGALFTFSYRPSLLTSAAAHGFSLGCRSAVVPLLPITSMLLPPLVVRSCLNQTITTLLQLERQRPRRLSVHRTTLAGGRHTRGPARARTPRGRALV